MHHRSAQNHRGGEDPHGWYTHSGPGRTMTALCLLMCLHLWACQSEEPLEAGRRLLADDRFEAALPLLQAAGPDADRYLARAYLGLAQFDAALAIVKRALERAPHDAELHEIHGTILTARAFAQNAFRNTTDAEAAFLRALELDPHRVHAHYNLGVIYAHHDRTADARTRYLAALSIDSTLVAAHKKVAELFRRAGDPEAALKHYVRATQLDDADAQAFYYVGVILRDSGRHDEAVTAFDRAAELNPHSPQILWGLGQAHVRTGNREEGKRVLERSRALRQQDRDLGSDVTPPGAGAVPIGPAKAHHGLGLHRAVRGDLEGSAREYRNAIAIDSTYVDGFSGLGAVLMMQGEFESAVDTLQRAATLTPDDTVLLTRLGLALLKADRLDESHDALTRAADQAQDFPELSYTRGLLAARMGDLVTARGHFGQAVELRPGYKDALLNLGVTSMKTRRYQMAVDAYARLVELDSTDARAHRYLSDAYGRLNRIVESQTHRRHAERLRAGDAE